MPSRRGRSPRAVARAHVAVLAAGVLFGTTFVVVKDAIVDAGPVPFLTVRFLIGAVVLWPFARGRPLAPGIGRAGLLAGLALLVGYVFQTVGLQYTTAAVSAFVTYMLLVIVPLISVVVLRRPPSLATIAGVVVATAGLVLLTGRGAGFHKGEVLTLGCALAFAVHIALLAEFSRRYDTIWLTAIQLAVVGGGCLAPGFFLGGYGFTRRALVAAVYTGVTVSAAAFALQVWGQRHVGPTRTALLLMIEPVAAAGLGYATGERLGLVAGLGALLILLGIAVSELPALHRPDLDRSVNGGDAWSTPTTSSAPEESDG